jgi:hypothetical protein
MRVAILLLHLPHALQTALQVAAPQHDAAAVAICVGRHQYGCRVVGTCARSCGCSLTVPTLGMASKGRLSKAPMVEMSSDMLVCDGNGCGLAGGTLSTSSYHLQAQSPPPVGV